MYLFKFKSFHLPDICPGVGLLDHITLFENEMFKTLCHELIHAILNTGNYYKSSNDEPMVEFLGRGIAELIRQNVLCK